MIGDRGTSGKQSLHTNRSSKDTVVFVTKGMVLNDRYKLVREIGRGGMAVVFEAEDKTLNGEKVAIKVLSPELAHSKAAIIRLKNEARAAMKLTHENIMRLNSFEEDGSHNFLVMELLDGENLEVALAEKGKLSVDDVLEIARGTAMGLSAAHEQNIIHRDIKPANLMYKTIGERQVIKIADFGIAFELKETLTRLTGMESAGTLLYAAPEQLEGALPDARSDQYALAATLYELLSGRPPFSGAGLSHQIINADPRPLEDVPINVDQAIRRALAKKPEDRFSDCKEFLAALETLPAVEEPAIKGSYRPLLGLLCLIGIFAFFHSKSDRPLPQPKPNHSPTSGIASLKPMKPSTPAVIEPVNSAPTKRPSVAVEQQVKVTKADEAVSVKSPKQSPNWGKIVITARPSFAALVLKRPNDNKFKPLSLRSGSPSKQLLAGTYAVSATASGYKSDDIIINVPADGSTFRGSISLAALPVKVPFRSTPIGCYVSINDSKGNQSKIGPTPCNRELSPGSYKIVFSKDGYSSSTKDVYINPGKSGGVFATLKSLPNVGYLKLTVSPVSAKVEVNDKLVNKNQWNKLELPIGSYVLSASLSGYESSSKQIIISRGKTLSESLELSKVVQTKPPQAFVKAPEDPNSATSIRNRLAEKKVKQIGKERTEVLRLLTTVESSIRSLARLSSPSAAAISSQRKKLGSIEAEIIRLKSTLDGALKYYGSTSAGEDLRGFSDAIISDTNKVKSLRKELANIQKKPSSEIKTDIERLQNRVQSKLRKGSEFNRARGRLRLYSPKRTIEVFMSSIFKRQETNFLACLSAEMLQKVQKQLSRKGTKAFYEELDKVFAKVGKPRSFRITVVKEESRSETEKRIRFKSPLIPKEGRATLIKSGRYWLLQEMN